MISPGTPGTPSEIPKLTLEQLSKAIWPFIVAEVIVLFLITFFADIPLLIPRLLGLA
ncbi:MAG: hypothetical protein AB1774_10285 [Bacillota bacterium]